MFSLHRAPSLLLIRLGQKAIGSVLLTGVLGLFLELRPLPGWHGPPQRQPAVPMGNQVAALRAVQWLLCSTAGSTPCSRKPGSSALSCGTQRAAHRAYDRISSRDTSWEGWQDGCPSWAQRIPVRAQACLSSASKSVRINCSVGQAVIVGF
jgi:hypothetical protein